jgi:hypothetical protein
MEHGPSSASAQIRILCGVADEKTRLPSKLTTRCCERTPAMSAVSSKTCLKSSCCATQTKNILTFLDSKVTIITKVPSTHPLHFISPYSRFSCIIQRMGLPFHLDSNHFWASALSPHMSRGRGSSDFVCNFGELRVESDVIYRVVSKPSWRRCTRDRVKSLSGRRVRRVRDYCRWVG